MQSLETIKSKGQESLARLVELGKSHPQEVQTWGVIGGTSLVGALAATAIAKGVVSIFATLASLPVALTVGAVAGGVLGWSVTQKSTARNEESVANTSTVLE